MKNQRTFMGLLVLLLTVLLVIPGAQAAEYSIGGGIGVAPDYEGSDDYQMVPIPAGDAKFDNGMFVKLMGLNLRANLIPSNFWRLGPVYNYRPSRSNVDNNRVDRMQNVDSANELGVFGGIEWENWFLSLEALGDTGSAYNGWYSTLKGGYNWMISNEWALSIGAHSTYANDDYMDTYFGVSNRDSRRSGLKRYNADGGIKDYGLDLGVNWNFASNWGLRGILSISQLVGDADDDSPVTDQGSETQVFTGVLVMFKF